MERSTGGITMRPGRPLFAILLLASLALAGCGLGSAPKTSTAPAAPAAADGTTAAPTTTATQTGAGSDPAGPTTGTKTPACAETHAWGTSTKQNARYSVAPLYHVRIGRHDCYDRVVFDINSPDAVGYHVQYVSVVREDGSGKPRPVAGGAALEVVVRAPAQGVDSQGHQPGRILAGPGQDFYTAAQLTGWKALREVRYAGSFEGQTTIAVGVRTRLPFRAFTLLDTQNHVMRVVLDVAHV